MKIALRDLTEYFFHPPHLADLQGETLDRRRKERGDTLLIIPSHHDAKRLGRLLDELAKQTFRKFDIAAIYSADDEFVPNKKLSIIHVKRKADFGFVGAGYLGQLIALKDSYRYHMIFTANMPPYSPKSLEILHGLAEEEQADYVNGKFAYVGVQYPDGSFKPTPPSISGIRWSALWSIIRTEKLKKIGLYPLPMYMGGDDTEYSYRLSGKCMKQLYPDEAIFKKTVRIQTMWRMISKGGTDSTYTYPGLFAARWMPEIAVSNSQNGFGGNLSQFLFTTLPLLVPMHMKLKLFEARMPEFKVYGEKISQMRFVVPSIAKTSVVADMQLIPAKKGKAETEQLEQHKLSNILTVLSHFLNKLKATDRSFYMVLNDNFYMVNPEDGNRYLVRWKRNIPIPAKAWLLFFSTLDVLLLVARIAHNKLLGRHLFDGYGMGAVDDAVKRGLAEKKG